MDHASTGPAASDSSTDADEPHSSTLEPAEPEPEVRELTRDDSFRFAGREFLDSIEALRETHAELTPAAAELDSALEIWKGALGQSKRLSAADLVALQPVFENIPKGGISAHDMLDRVWEAVEDKDWGPQFAYQLTRRLYRPRRQPIFHNAMLISAVAAFESHLSTMAELYYQSAPEALHKLPKEAIKEFSLRELQSLGSIDDAIELAIERRVSDLAFGSLSDWKKFFADRMNIDLAALLGSWPRIHEVFERRHCIVHSDGHASRRYIREYSDVELGEPLHATNEYVSAALDSLELLGVLLHSAVWAKFALDKQEVVDSLEATAFESLKAGRWEYSLKLYEYWQNLPLSAAERHMADVNVWIARKNLNGLASIEKEVDAWDISGSDDVYGFAKLCLLEDLDAAFAMLPDLVKREKVEGRELATWPLLSPLRDDERIKEYAGIMRDYLSEEADTAADSAESEEPLPTSEDRSPSAGDQASDAGGIPSDPSLEVAVRTDERSGDVG